MFAEQVWREKHPILTPIFIRLRDIDTFEVNFEAVWPEKRSYVYKCISINIHKVYHVKIVYHNQLLLVCVQRYIQIEFSPNCSYN